MLHSISLIQVAEPISTWKVYFRSPPGEVYARNLKSNLGVSHCAQSGENFFSLLGFFFFLFFFFLRLLEQNGEGNKGSES